MILSFAAALSALLLQTADTAPATAPKDTAEQRATAASANGTTNTAAAPAITDKDHPDYVRCRSEKVIGSLAKRKKTCMTNREWEVAARVGNRGARDIVESQQVGMSGQ